MNEKPTEKQISYAESLGIDNPEKYSKSELRGLIDAKKKEKEGGSNSGAQNGSKRFSGASQNYDKTKAMYVSYAKDIFLRLLADENERPMTRKGLMDEAIALVQQAIGAF